MWHVALRTHPAGLPELSDKTNLPTVGSARGGLPRGNAGPIAFRT